MKASIVVNRDAVDPTGRRHQVFWAEAFAEGLRRQGVEVETLEEGQSGAGDFHVCWGWRIGEQLPAPCLILERGYLGDHRAWTSAGWDGLNGRADFCNQAVPADRWKDHFADLLRPWKEGGDYCLLLGQVRGDAAVTGVNLPDWYGRAVTHLRRFDLPVMFRPHPRDPCHAPDGAYGLNDCGDIRSALAQAAVAVTYNSTAGVDAVLSGTAVIACDEGSMAWPVAAHGLEADPIKPDRTHWMARMAYTQWNDSEFRSGLAWEHLKGRLS